jgi:hypothetical protein
VGIISAACLFCVYPMTVGVVGLVCAVVLVCCTLVGTAGCVSPERAETCRSIEIYNKYTNTAFVGGYYLHSYEDAR